MDLHKSELSFTVLPPWTFRNCSPESCTSLNSACQLVEAVGREQGHLEKDTFQERLNCESASIIKPSCAGLWVAAGPPRTLLGKQMRHSRQPKEELRPTRAPGGWAVGDDLANFSH